jgi:hypothetical protein
MTQDTLRDALEAAVETHDVEEPQTEAAPLAEALETTPSAPAETAAETAQRERDERGRFAPKSEVTAVVPTEPTKALPAVPAVERPPRPSSWKKDYWDDWDKLDPKVAKYVTQREQEYANGVSTYKQEAERAREIFDVIAPYQQLIEKEGGTPARAVQQLLNTAALLRTSDPQTKANLLLQVAQQYGVPLEYMLNGQQQAPAQVDPQTAWLREQVQQLQGWKDNFVSTQEQAVQSQINQEIEDFKQDKPHFEAVRKRMAGLLRAGLADDLNSAYTAAVRMDDNLFEQTLQERTTNSARQQHVAKAKAAAVSVKSSTPSAMTTPSTAKGLRAQLEEVFDASTGGGRV